MWLLLIPVGLYIYKSCSACSEGCEDSACFGFVEEDETTRFEGIECWYRFWAEGGEEEKSRVSGWVLKPTLGIMGIGKKPPNTFRDELGQVGQGVENRMIDCSHMASFDVNTAQLLP